MYTLGVIVTQVTLQKMTQISEYLTFDDVLLLPKHSNVLPSDANFETSLSDNIKLKTPILSAAMDTVTELDMAISMAELGGLGVIHKNLSVSDQANIVKKVKEKNLLSAAAIGVGDDALRRAEMLVNEGLDLIVVDTAHGHSQLVLDMVKNLRNQYKNLTIVAGNIATAEAALDLKNAGADAVKVGIGPGSICTTRIVTGVGAPQLTAILNIKAALKDTNIKIIADGGIKNSGDIVKALAAGADAVMLGGLLAGTKEAVGEIVEIDGKKYKSYRGMGSEAAAQKGSDDRYFQHKRKGKFIPEGVEGMVEYKGPVNEVIEQLVGGLRLGMGYLGAKNLDELKANAEFIKITQSGKSESHIHNLAFAKNSSNYRVEK